MIISDADPSKDPGEALEDRQDDEKEAIKLQEEERSLDVTLIASKSEITLSKSQY